MPDLIHTFETTTDSFLAEAAAEALGKIDDAFALWSLRRAAETGTVRARRAAEKAIECILGSGALPKESDKQ